MKYYLMSGWILTFWFLGCGNNSMNNEEQEHSFKIETRSISDSTILIEIYRLSGNPKVVPEVTIYDSGKSYLFYQNIQQHKIKNSNGGILDYSIRIGGNKIRDTIQVPDAIDSLSLDSDFLDETYDNTIKLSNLNKYELKWNKANGATSYLIEFYINGWRIKDTATYDTTISLTYELDSSDIYTSYVEVNGILDTMHYVEGDLTVLGYSNPNSDFTKPVLKNENLSIIYDIRGKRNTYRLLIDTD